ncbi:alpha/beta fold hydrolase [Acidisphaera sp. L21]|uniref:alpha/beta fold hydrolase n=1 Tax=Acidisphaera sp. L21 TaxID=1641851 RepID=UPI0020B174CA|nr:alpha/beta fold hydrolase [Acidisphaera sp. L21]
MPPLPPPNLDPAFVRGIAAYRRHPYQRDLADPPVLWSEGGSRLLDYGGTGPLLLVVPSLINRAYVLDLAAERSMLRFWAANGVHPVLLDWGWPGPLERQFTLTDYVAIRLANAIAALPGPVTLVGYCMGGLLTLAAALRAPTRVNGLVLLATPWDFHAADPQAGPRASAAAIQLGPMLAAGALPVDAVHGMFAMQGAEGVAARYRTFPDLDPASERARMFVALEDWLWDGMPLAGPVAAECIGGWYGENTPATGQWRIDGTIVDPAALRMPTLVAIPSRDRIVPPESAAPLAGLIPGATILRPAGGHVGMVVGARAHSELWQPVLGWLHAQ